MLLSLLYIVLGAISSDGMGCFVQFSKINEKYNRYWVDHRKIYIFTTNPKESAKIVFELIDTDENFLFQLKSIDFTS